MPKPARTPATSDTKRALIYVRQSITVGDDSLSLASQEHVLREWCDAESWRVVDVIRDANERGWNDQRPGLLELVERCKAGSVDLVLVWDISRLARSVRIQENVLHDLAAHGVHVYSKREDWVREPLFRHILGAIAEHQTKVIAANVKRGLHERRRSGKWHGVVPFGYTRAESGALAPDPDTREWVGQIFDWTIQGVAFTAIAKRLDASGISTPGLHRGGTRWNHQTVQWIIANPAYLGHSTFQGSDVRDTHEPLVTADQFERAHYRRANWNGGAMSPQRSRAGRSSVVTTFLRDGLAICQCGAKLYPMHSGKEIQIVNGERHVVPREILRCASTCTPNRPTCACRPHQVALSTAEAFVRSELPRVLAARLDWRTVARRAAQDAAKGHPGTERRVRTLGRRREAIQAEYDRALHLAVKGLIGDDEFAEIKTRLDAERRDLDGELQPLTGALNITEMEAVDIVVQRVMVMVSQASDSGISEAMRTLAIRLVKDPGAPEGLRLESTGPLRRLWPMSLR